jgi:hypothetical protein
MKKTDFATGRLNLRIQKPKLGNRLPISEINRRLTF